MPYRVPSMHRISRRDFAATVCGCLLSGLELARDCVADDPLHVLRPGDLERLRWDFNASRTKVRLLSVLSPT